MVTSSHESLRKSLSDPSVKSSHKSSRGPSDAEGNIYEFNALSVLRKHAAYVQGNPNCTLVVIHSAPLNAQSCSALEASAERLGFGQGSIAWVAIQGIDGCEETIAPRSLRELVEGIDPISLATADTKATNTLSQAYDTTLETDAANRVMCRTVIAFDNFGGMLRTPEDKQRAWHLLKQLR